MVHIRFILCAFLTLFAAGNAAADSQHVRSLKLHVDLEKDGTAKVYERWDVATGDNITEWYLVRDNLGDIVIDSLEVCVDEVPSHFEGEWNVDRTLGEKAGKCGIVHRASGVELCWGIGSHGDHVFEAVYRMHGAVKSARDYDYLHLQLVSPGLSSPPEQVQVFLGSDYVQLDTTTARVWGFGYEGICLFENGQVVMESDGPFGIDDSVIVLLRLDKGILEPTSLRDQDFQEVLDMAMEEADFGNYEPWEEDDTETLIGLGLLGLGFLGIYAFIKKWIGRDKQPAYKIRHLLGVREKNIPWYRDIPFNGNLPAAKYFLGMIAESDLWNAVPLTSALILRMVYNGYLDVSRLLEKENTEIRFTDKQPGDLDRCSRTLYDMLKKAAGENNILEKDEFSKWATYNHGEVHHWCNASRDEARAQLQIHGWSGSDPDKLTDAGKEEGKHLLGLRKFLMDFTLTREREAFDAHLWKEYMVYGTLLGIAQIVSKQLKEIAPQYSAGDLDSVLTTSMDFSQIVRTANVLHIRSTIPSSSYGTSSESTRSSRSYSSSASRSGHGGRSSHSGGHGHSSGGRGGGGR